jgi:signal transduction histidine kinase
VCSPSPARGATLTCRGARRIFGPGRWASHVLLPSNQVPRSAIEIPADSAGQGSKVTYRRLHLRLLTLAFSGPTAQLEAPFLEEYARDSLKQLRITLLLGVLFYGAFAVLDQLMLQQYKHVAWLIRFAVVCPAISLAYFATYRPWFKPLMQPLLSALNLLGGVGIIVMIAVIPAPVSQAYYAGLVLVLMFSYLFVRHRFVWATATGCLLVALYEAAALGLTETPGPVLVSNSFFLVSANLACMGICYSMEYFVRRDFYLVHLLTLEQERVRRINRSLEEKVEARTAELRRSNRSLEQEIAEHQRAEEERQRLEERLNRAEKMEAIGTLAGGVAHDLNNVLGIVVGYAELLLGEAAMSGRLRHHAERIMNGGERAAAIVQDLLTMARRGVPTRKVVDLNGILAEYTAAPEFAKLLASHPKLRVVTAPGAGPLHVVGSPVHLGKSILNLVINAAEAMPNGGTVTITTGHRYLDRPVRGYDDVRQGDYVVLSVSDTGEGIPATDLKRIFEPFYTRKVMGRSGTGLGLAVVWGTVKDHSGYIDVESREGRGSTFTLYLPVTTEEPSHAPVAESLAACLGRGESILVVDDVEGQRDLATRMLQKLNYSVVAVASGEEALSYLGRTRVDLVVLDMIMDPGMDGLDTYERILATNPGQKAIVVSGFSESDRVSRVRELGVGAYLGKPYVLAHLGMAVRKELDRTS